jgi:hypothetical protein
MSDLESKRDDPVVYLATAPNEPFAQMWATSLRDDGIEVMIKPLGPGAGGWGSSFSFEHELYVLKSQFDAALRVIEDQKGQEGDNVTE